MAQLEGAARTACAACDRHRHSKHGVLEHGHLVEYTHQGTSYTLGLFATLDESHRVCDVLAIKDAVDAGVDLGTLNPHVSLDKYGVDGSTSWAIGWASFPQIVRDLQEYTVRKLPGHELSETVLSSGDAGVSSGGHARDEAQSGQHALPDPSVQRGVRAPPAPAPHSVACGPAYSLASNASMLSGISAAQAMLNLARASDAAEAETRGHAGAVPQRAPAPHAPPPRFDGQPQQPWQQQTHLEVLPANGGVNISAAPTTARKRPHEATGESAAAAPTAAGAHPCSANGGGGAAAARATAAAAAAAVAEMAGRAREAAMLKQPGPSGARGSAPAAGRLLAGGPGASAHWHARLGPTSSTHPPVSTRPASSTRPPTSARPASSTRPPTSARPASSMRPPTSARPAGSIHPPGSNSPDGSTPHHAASHPGVASGRPASGHTGGGT